MAKKVAGVEKKVAAEVHPGHSFVSTSKLGIFLRDTKCIYVSCVGGKKKNIKSELTQLYQQWFVGFVSREVVVVGKVNANGHVELDNGLVKCTFRARGNILETMYVPPGCITKIVPVMVAKDNKEDETNRLVPA